ncbi:MAG: prolyl oligopeptidase family serine peptidase, partial [Prevotella sp.]|nr:prolyl oligopeptidase family serine peptidase [Prevotella sp.]
MNKRTLLAAALAVLLPIQTLQAEDMIGKQHPRLNSRMMSAEALWAMGRIGGYAASPDGQHIVYQVGYYSVKQNKSHHVLYMMNADGTGQTLLTKSSKHETDASWLDAQTLAFISDGEVWTMHLEGTERRQLTKTDGEVEGYKFSPDRQHILIVKQIPYHESIKENPSDLPKATGRLVTDLNYRHWDTYVETIPHPFVGDVTAEGVTNLRDIMEGEPYECPVRPFGGMEQLDWSCDSKQIAYAAKKMGGVDYMTQTDTDIYLYNIGTRETKNLCKPAGYQAPKSNPTKTLRQQAVNSAANLGNNPGYDQMPKFSPDGRWLAWTSMARNGYESDRNRLCLYDLQNGTKTYVTEAFDSNIDDYCWSDTKDARLYFIGVWHATENLYAIDAKGAIRQLTNDCADFGSIQLMNNGRQLLAERHSYTAPADLYVVTPSKKVKKGEQPTEGLAFTPSTVTQLTQENAQILKQLDTPSVEKRWVTTTDGQQMLYWVVLPPNFDATKKYPTLLFCEGGPQSPVSQFWSYRWNFMIMASQGYVVVAPNRRGLPGFGSAWCEQISGDWTGQCMKDYLTAIDDACAQLPYVDKDRLGAVGASFGGFSVYYLAGHHEKRFKCFIS